MRDETPEHPAPLRSGYTTGSCATATSLAAARHSREGDHTPAAHGPEVGRSSAEGILAAVGTQADLPIPVAASRSPNHPAAVA